MGKSRPFSNPGYLHQSLDWPSKDTLWGHSKGLIHPHLVLSVQFPSGSQGGHAGPHSVAPIPPGPGTPRLSATGSGPLWALGHSTQCPLPGALAEQNCELVSHMNRGKVKRVGKEKQEKRQGRGEEGNCVCCHHSSHPEGLQPSWTYDVLCQLGQVPFSKPTDCLCSPGKLLNQGHLVAGTRHVLGLNHWGPMRTGQIMVVSFKDFHWLGGSSVGGLDCGQAMGSLVNWESNWHLQRRTVESPPSRISW